jgi:hypothetical protein
MIHSKSVRDILIIFKKLKVWILSFILGLIFLLTLQYLNIEVFNKEQNIPFSGDLFYNPYKNFTTNTLKANFHTHSKSQNNTDNNPNDPARILEHYKSNGYDIISLSNYQKISKDLTASNYIPVYEHGYNVKKTHQLVINSEKVSFFDFPLFQNYNTEQQVIRKLSSTGGLIALAHPNLREAYKESDMKYLKGYDFIEVFNNYKISANIWDAALTSGYPAWLLADDDCHDISRSNLSFNNWTRISSTGGTREEIISALKRGSHYGVRNLTHKEVNFLDSCVVKGNYINVYFRNKADKIIFISDNGSVKREISDVANAQYEISGNESYVRIEAINGDEMIYLNPVIRYNGRELTINSGFPTINIASTLILRSLFFISGISILLLILILNGLIIFPVRKFKPGLTIRTRGEVSLG